MKWLSAQQRNFFLTEIKSIGKRLINFKSDNTLQGLEQFENLLTLNELAGCCLRDSVDEGNTLAHFLSQRWERIRNSSLCYTQKPTNLTNQLCYKIAETISSLTEPNQGPYALLMPSLVTCEDVYEGNIHELALHEFILSDNECFFIPLVQCLEEASLSDEGQFRHLVKLGDTFPPNLTPKEIERLVGHSTQASALYEAVVAYNKGRLLSDDIGAKLSQLTNALRRGGAHASGSEYNAGSAANEGILTFHEYWHGLEEKKRKAILAEAPELEDLLGRLFRPREAKYEETRFCVELIAGTLEPIIKKFNAKPTIIALENQIASTKKTLEKALKKGPSLVIVQNTNPPKHILHLIFKLKSSTQNNLFKDDKNALMYALKYVPESLAEFELNEALKRQVVVAKVGSQTALIIAAAKGVTDAVKLLLEWGADTELRGMDDNTALHWAAFNGHLDAVNCLLKKEANLEAKNIYGNTPLQRAIIDKKSAVAKRLLAVGANLTTRNNDGENALELAIEHLPQLIEPILMKLVTLPVNEQAECLLEMPHGPYPHVLFYAAAKHASLFNSLIDKASTEQEGKSLFEALDKNGLTLLAYAAALGAHQSIPKLLALNLNIESKSSNQNTALHLAAFHGHFDAVNCLLKKGANLEAKNCDGVTPLQFAIKNKQSDVAKHLLTVGANLITRNNEGKNALELAINHLPPLIEPLLMKLVTLPADKQAECLAKIQDGLYPNVLFYAAAKHMSSLFNSLIDKAWEQKDNALFKTSDKNGLTLLAYAAELGAHQSIPKLLALNLIDIESKDHRQNTALHLAAFLEHFDAVNCLLEKGANLEAKNCDGVTPLQHVIIGRRSAIAECLLTAGANISTRNNDGKNALELAIEHAPWLTQPILMKLVTLPADEQAECLLEMPNGPYKNAYSYAIVNSPDIFEQLLTNRNNSAVHKLSALNFFADVLDINQLFHRLNNKSKNNSNYIAAASAAKMLLEKWANAAAALCQSEEVITDEAIQGFQAECINAVNIARPVLEEHREKNKFVGKCVLTAMTFPVSVPLGFFSLKTQSAQLIDSLNIITKRR